MTRLLHFVLRDGASFDVELSDAEFNQLERCSDRERLTLDQLLARIIADFISTHPIIAQTRRPQ